MVPRDLAAFRDNTSLPLCCSATSRVNTLRHPHKPFREFAAALYSVAVGVGPILPACRAPSFLNLFPRRLSALPNLRGGLPDRRFL
jgi:hypothetical protein